MRKQFKSLENNQPEHRPGAYGLLHLSSNRWYIGIGKDLASRLQDHANFNKWKGEKKLLAILERDGVEAFLAIPLFYQFTYSRKLLLKVETQLITLYDSVRNGFNIIESQENGCEYGLEFVAICKAAHARPEVKVLKQKVAREFRARPGVKEMFSAAMIEAHSRPDVKQRHREGIHKSLEGEKGERKLAARSEYMKAHPEKSAILRNPEVIAKAAATRRISANTPEGKAKRSAAARSKTPECHAAVAAKLRNKKTITNGVINKRIDKDLPLPEDFHYGQTNKPRKQCPKTQNQIQAMAKFQNCVWITNGVNNKRLKNGNLVPEGFRLGMIHHSKTS